MAQSTILAAGNSAATSTDIAVAAGATVTVGIFSAAGNPLPVNVQFTVWIDTPGADQRVTSLGLSTGADTVVATQLSGPGTFRVTRPAYTGEAYGVFLEA